MLTSSSSKWKMIFLINVIINAGIFGLPSKAFNRSAGLYFIRHNDFETTTFDFYTPISKY